MYKAFCQTSHGHAQIEHFLEHQREGPRSHVKNNKGQKQIFGYGLPLLVKPSNEEPIQRCSAGVFGAAEFGTANSTGLMNLVPQENIIHHGK